MFYIQSVGYPTGPAEQDAGGGSGEGAGEYNDGTEKTQHLPMVPPTVM